MNAPFVAGSNSPTVPTGRTRRRRATTYSPATRQTRQRRPPRFALPCRRPARSELRQGGFQDEMPKTNFHRTSERNSTDWHRHLEIYALTDSLIR